MLRCGGMSILFEVILELIFHVIGCVLEGLFSGIEWEDSRTNRIVLCVVLVVLGIIIWWALR